MGFARRVMRKSVRKATPRSVRKAMHPIGSMKSAVTPRPVKRMSRSIYTVTNPLGAAENALIGAALNGGRKSPRRSSRGHPISRKAAGRASSRVGGRPSSNSTVGQTPSVAARTEQAADAQESLALLMAVQRERFTPAVRPIVPLPPATSATAMAKEQWRQRKGEVPFWQSSKRRTLKQDIAAAAQRASEQVDESNAEQTRARQADADRWWRQLKIGDQQVLTTALDGAFADNPAPVQIIRAEGSEAALLLLLPDTDVLPDRRASTTTAGRPSTKAWTKTEFAEVYAQLLAAHLLATLRETWAVGSSVQAIRVIGVRRRRTASEVLFDVEADRASAAAGDNSYGDQLLRQSDHGLHRTGRTREVTSWPLDVLDPQVEDFLK